MIIAPGEDGYFVVTSPDVPSCISQGRTWAEAERAAKYAVESMLEFELAMGLRTLPVGIQA
ncbi:MAG TPA: type II toxin-antitoxin system HicB family antitoxin [Armatimonadetes bacterium]|nr:type II toxin-antitoxin system HicB family antitoxin [Armatimonadota bacterium]